MTVQIKYKNSLSKKNTSNLILFADEKFNILKLKKQISGLEYSFISDLLKTANLKNKIVTFDISSKKKIILISITNNIKSFDIENLGAKFYDLLKDFKSNECQLNSNTVPYNIKNLVGHFLHGLTLKSYTFDKYKTKKSKKKITIFVTGENKPSFKEQIKFKAIEEGSFYTRDLVSEPGNVLHPDEYAKRISALKKYGLKIKFTMKKN
tara:strand:- start:137 stop:760 length:624 start_codon:yes stop_codon:yes gene_type:complete